MFVGQRRESAMRNLGLLQAEHDFDVAFLSEAKALDGAVLPGYVNHAGGSALGADHDNCRILLRRDGFEVLDQGAWKVPGKGWEWKKPKPTRVYSWLAARRTSDGAVFVFVSVHRIPGGPVTGIKANQVPWGNEHTSIVAKVRELRARFPSATVVLGGDWNARMDERPGHHQSLAALARDLSATDDAVLHIDGLIVIGGRTRKVHKLDGKYGSDGHRPVVGQVIPA